MRQRIANHTDKKSWTSRTSEAGICWHLISQEQAERVASHQIPEILAVIYRRYGLFCRGCRDINQLNWLDKPTPQALHASRFIASFRCNR